MQTISENLKTLLKSKAMVGPNAPTARLILDGVSGGADISFINGMTPLFCGYNATGYKAGVSNYIADANGNEFCLIINSSDLKVYKGTMANNEDYFEMDYPVTTVTDTGITVSAVGGDGLRAVLHKLSDGKILAFIDDPSILDTKKAYVRCYISNNGLGTDFQYWSTVYESAIIPFNDNAGGGGCQLSICTVGSDGALLMSSYTRDDYGDGISFWDYITVFKSTDNGVTWAKKYHKQRNASKNITQITELPDGIFFSSLNGSGGQYFYKSTDGGETWTSLGSNNEKYINLGINSAQHIADYHLDKETNILYAWSSYGNQTHVAEMQNPTLAKVLGFSVGYWDTYYDVPDWSSSWSGYMSKNASGNFVCAECSEDDRVGGLLRELIDPIIPLKSVKIDREQSAMAQRLSADIPNVSPTDPSDTGYYTPFRGIDVPADANAFMDKIKPGTGVTCEMGYGTELTTTFVGAIDDVEISADTGFNIKIECRDSAWKLLDTIVASELGYYILYQNQTIEYMVSDLLQKAGIPSADITTEATGISVVEISFSRCTYADAVEQLLDICGYDLICDELGKFSLVKPKNPDPLVAAYEFIEGVDITKMSLKLTRNDIYARVQVTSKIDGVDGAAETYIVKEYVYENASSYGIPNHKTLFLDVSNITDELELQAMADQVGYEMTRRLITVEFQCAFPVFQLQVGDVIRVTESSTTISEIYRITAMSMEVNSEGAATMSLKCFHYGA